MPSTETPPCPFPTGTFPLTIALCDLAGTVWPAEGLLCRRYPLIVILLFETQTSLCDHGHLAGQVPPHPFRRNTVVYPGAPRDGQCIVRPAAGGDRGHSRHQYIFQVAVALAGGPPIPCGGRFVLADSHPTVLPEPPFVTHAPAVFEISDQGAGPDHTHSGNCHQTVLLLFVGFDQIPQDFDVGCFPRSAVVHVSIQLLQ